MERARHTRLFDVALAHGSDIFRDCSHWKKVQVLVTSIFYLYKDSIMVFIFNLFIVAKRIVVEPSVVAWKISVRFYLTNQGRKIIFVNNRNGCRLRKSSDRNRKIRNRSGKIIDRDMNRTLFLSKRTCLIFAACQIAKVLI